VYENGSPEQKRSVVGSMFPEKMTCDGFLLRTGRVNEATRVIYSMGKRLGENKKDKRVKKLFCPVR
jgi:hypothetical protein